MGIYTEEAYPLFSLAVQMHAHPARLLIAHPGRNQISTEKRAYRPLEDKSAKRINGMSRSFKAFSEIDPN